MRLRTGWGLARCGVLLVLAASAYALSPSEISAMRQSRRLARQHERVQPKIAVARKAPAVPSKASAESVIRAQMDAEFRRAAAKTMGGEDVFRKVPGMSRTKRPHSAPAASQQTGAEAKQAAFERAEEEFLAHESPMAVHDCGIYGDECNEHGVTPDAGTKGDFMKARTQSLALSAASADMLELPDCSVVDCGAQLNFQRFGVKHAGAPRRLPARLHSGVRWPAVPRKASPSLTVRPVGQLVAQAAPAATPAVTPALSKQDIKALAHELLDEAADPDRSAAQDHERARQQSIRAAVGGGVASLSEHEADDDTGEDTGMSEDGDCCEWEEGEDGDGEWVCRHCANTEEDYDMWNNVNIFPRDETGFGQSYLHVLLALIGIIATAMLCAFCYREAGKEEGPIGEGFQHAKDAWVTVTNSAGDAIENAGQAVGLTPKKDA